MENVYDYLVNRIDKLHEQVSAQQKRPARVLIALAGVPGAGKSTVAEEVVTRLNKAASIPRATVLPMDGFHLPRRALSMRADSAEAFARRGAPWTFDAQGVVDLVSLLESTRRDDSWLSMSITAPGFDHVIKDPVPDAITVSADISIIILEGNWLLLDEKPWSAISNMVDDCWFVDIDPDDARKRIAKRHLKSGIETTYDAALERAEFNDLPNGDLVRSRLAKANITIMSVEED